MRYARARHNKTGVRTVPQRLLFLRPPDLPQDDSDAEHKKYRLRMARWSTKVAVVMGVFVVAGAWALSPIGFARAADVKAQIDKALEPIQQQQANLASQLAEVKATQARDSRRLAVSLSNGVASEIRSLRLKICKGLPTEDRDRLWREIGRLQDEYSELRGAPYNVPSCGEL